jgi:hypothetical protein|tara:strand:- start:325 stop:570 length:246 start_codon:yes stop_codon:yes gene_type:complete
LVLVVLDLQGKILLDQMVLILLLALQLHYLLPLKVVVQVLLVIEAPALDVLVRLVDVVVAVVRNHTLVAVKTKHHKTPHFK